MDNTKPIPSVIKPAAASVEAAAPAHDERGDPPFMGRPRTRRYLMECNAKCPEDGAFNGVCKVYFRAHEGKGDRFFYVSQPVKRRVDGKIVLSNETPPTWADVVDEYPLLTEPQPFARVPGAAPGANRTMTNAELAASR